MASIFRIKPFRIKPNIQPKIRYGLGLTVCGSLVFGMPLFFGAALQAQGVFQGDTTGITFSDGSTIAGVGLPKSKSVSDFITYEAALNVSQQAQKIASAMQTNSFGSFGQNFSPAAQQVLFSLLTNPGFDTKSALTERIKIVGVSPELARELSDRLEGLFVSSSGKKWQINSDFSVNAEQLSQAVDALNQVINAADPLALTNPPDEFAAIQKVLAQLVASSNKN